MIDESYDIWLLLTLDHLRNMPYVIKAEINKEDENGTVVDVWVKPPKPADSIKLNFNIGEIDDD